MPDVVVVGAGVIGASVAWHLARQGLRALVLEREASPGQGSVSRSARGARPRPGMREPVPLERQLRARSHARARPRTAAGGYHRARQGPLARRARAAPLAVRGRGAESRAPSALTPGRISRL